MDRFDAISAFVAVADRQGFAPAARQLNISPSAITRLIAALEDHLGVRLFQRTTRAVRLTDSGERFLQRARRILDDLDEAERMAETERGTPAGRLVLSAPLVFGRLHVSTLVCAYMNAHPQVNIDLQLSDRMVNLIDDGIDAAFRIGHLTDTTLIARRLGVTRQVLVASPAYLANNPKISTPHDLAPHRLIATTQSTWRFHHAGQDLAIDIRPAYTTNSAEAAATHAANAGGIAQLRLYQIADHLRAGTLEILLPDWEPAPQPIQLVYPTSRLLSVKVRALIDLAVKTTNWNFLAA
jgi:DNA-binding transcriptional LysR family regulator